MAAALLRYGFRHTRPRPVGFERRECMALRAWHMRKCDGMLFRAKSVGVAGPHTSMGDRVSLKQKHLKVEYLI